MVTAKFHERKMSKIVLAVSIVMMLAFAPQLATASITVTATCNEEIAAWGASVSFTGSHTGDAYHSCSNTTYSWTFGDGGTSTAQNPSHTYTQLNAGVKTVTLTVTCGGESDSDTCTVWVVKDIIIDQQATGGRPDDKMCFNSNNRVIGHLIPSAVQAKILQDRGQIIDWKVDDWAVTECVLLNDHDGDLDLIAGQWPDGNDDWGADALIACIDKFTGQDGDLDTSGYLQASINIKKFFEDGDGKCQKSSDPNWYYYYADALGIQALASYDGGSYYGFCDPNNSQHPITFGVNANDTNNVYPTTNFHIDTFWNTWEHESKHKSHYTHNDTYHPGITYLTSYLPSADDSDGDDLCNVGCQAGGWEATHSMNQQLQKTDGINMDSEKIAINAETQITYDANGDPTNGYTSVDWAYPGNQWALSEVHN